MKTEKSFLDKERERERRLVNCDESWRSRIRRFFTRTREDPVRTLTDERRDDIVDYYTYHSFATDVYTKAILDHIESEGSNLAEYVYNTISDKPSCAGTITMRKLAEDNVTVQMYEEAIKAMKTYGRKD